MKIFLNKILPSNKPTKPAEKEENECYICLKQCNNKSPCKCNSYIHLPCLIKTKLRWKNNTCPVCKQDYNDKYNKLIKILKNINLNYFKKINNDDRNDVDIEINNDSNIIIYVNNLNSNQRNSDENNNFLFECFCTKQGCKAIFLWIGIISFFCLIILIP